MPSPCLYCRQPLMFVSGRGYRHPGGTVVQWCPERHQEFICGPSPAPFLKQPQGADARSLDQGLR